MATIIKNASFTSTITDRVALNGVNYGNTNTKSISNCNESFQKIVTIPFSTSSQSWVSLFGADGAPDVAGDVTFDEFKYARITNLDDTNSLFIQITNDTKGSGGGGTVNGAVLWEVPAGMSFIVPSLQFDAGTSTLTGTSLTSSTVYNTGVAVYAVAITADVDAEIFVVTT